MSVLLTGLGDRLQNIQNGPHPGPLPSMGRGRIVGSFVGYPSASSVPPSRTMVKALIFDLDNCLAAANEVGEELFEPAFEAMRQANRRDFRFSASSGKQDQGAKPDS